MTPSSSNAAGTPGNTGVQTAIDISIDTAHLTFPLEVTREQVQSLFTPNRRAPSDTNGATDHQDGAAGEVAERAGLGVETSPWVPIGGRYGYAAGERYGAVCLYYNGTHPGMGIHVQISGKGADQLQASGVVREWPDFLKEMLALGARFRRLDVALDDQAGILSMVELEQCYREGLLSSHCRKLRFAETRDRDGVCVGSTVCIGAGKSETLLRIYDKAAEQNRPEHWIRVELQLRSRRAEAAAKLLAEQGLAAAAGLVRNHVEFKTRGRHSQRERWPIAPWWAEFLDNCDKFRLSTRRPTNHSIEHNRWWVQRHSRMLSFLLLHPEAGFDELMRIVAEGAARLYRWQLDALEQAGVMLSPSLSRLELGTGGVAVATASRSVQRRTRGFGARGTSAF